MLSRLFLIYITIILGLLLSACNFSGQPLEVHDLDEITFEDTYEDLFLEDDSDLVTQGIYSENNKLAKTINFGNMLEAPNEGDWGLSLKAEYFQLAKQAGFTAVRLPISWTYHTSQIQPYTIDETFFSRVDWAITQASIHDLNIIINVHHYDAIHENPTAEQDRFLAIWSQIAIRYKDQTRNVFFEVLNEPHGVFTDNPNLWNDLLSKAIEEIRKSNPTRPLIVGPVAYNSINYLEQLRLPEDTNLIATAHFYDPFEFTHQGAEWVDPSPPVGEVWTGNRRSFAWDNWSWDTNLKWDANSRGVERLRVEFLEGWAGLYLHTEEVVSGYDTLFFVANRARNLRVDCDSSGVNGASPISVQTKHGWAAYEVDISECKNITDIIIMNNSSEPQEAFYMPRIELRNQAGQRHRLIVTEKLDVLLQLHKARKWSVQNRIPLFIGEFGAYNKADLASRVKWTAFVRQSMERRRMTWAYWEFGAGFGVYDPEAKAWRTELLEALMPQ